MPADDTESWTLAALPRLFRLGWTGPRMPGTHRALPLHLQLSAADGSALRRHRMSKPHWSLLEEE